MDHSKIYVQDIESALYYMIKKEGTAKVHLNFIIFYIFNFVKANYSESEKNGLFETIRVINEYLPMRKFVEKFFRRLAKLTIDYEEKELTQKLYKKILGS